ncbi:MAG: nuclear transport factor 2 family protein, partial [Candidatus Heimdallarchaeota archaeon]|nr:nuclear transport factor 2 family protein [Candidatus Heimdallarchaeota archaeon]
KLIKKTLQNYTKAFQKWDIGKLVAAFHPEAKTTWYIPERGGYISGMCYGWIRGFIKNKKEKLVIGYTTFDEKIDQSGTAAYVRFRFLVEDGEYSRDTTDYLTLLKIGEDWNIVNKSGFTMDKTVEEIAKIKEEKTKTNRNIPNELELITLKLKTYAEAFDEWDIEKIRNVFHPEVRVNSVDDETNKFKCQTRSIGVWKEVFENHQKDNVKFKTQIEFIDQLGTSAVVRMRWLATKENFRAVTVDYLTFLKVDGDWLIVNKTCHSEEIKN